MNLNAFSSEYKEKKTTIFKKQEDQMNLPVAVPSL